MSSYQHVALQVPMKKEPLSVADQEVQTTFRRLSEQDRDVMEKAVKAFVSFVRAYKEHQCRSVTIWQVHIMPELYTHI